MVVSACEGSVVVLEGFQKTFDAKIVYHLREDLFAFLQEGILHSGGYAVRECVGAYRGVL